MKCRTELVLLSVIFLAASCVAQRADRLNFSVGAGFSAPTESAANNLNTGWNLDFRGGYNITRRLAADLDFSYSRSNLNSAALARFAEPGGDVGIWSLTFNPVYRLLPARSPVNAYVTGGFGLYHRNLTLTQPVAVNTVFCDPFFGCYPATFTVNQVVASFDTYKGGFNAGGGLEFRPFYSRVRIFSEARYQRMFTTNGDDITYVPVTFGLRW